VVGPVTAAAGLIVNEMVPIDWPAGIVRLLGREASKVVGLLPALNDNICPPAGAGPARVIVPVKVSPGAAVAAFNANDTMGFDAVMISFADAEVPLNDAVIVADLSVVVAPVEEKNVPDVAPLGMVIDAGTDARDGSLLDRVTVTPPARAGRSSLIVPQKK